MVTTQQTTTTNFIFLRSNKKQPILGQVVFIVDHQVAPKKENPYNLKVGTIWHECTITRINAD